MPIRDCPFSILSANNIARPILPIRIINPHTNKSLRTYGLIDTGADECAVPASFASFLEHNLQAGKTKTIGTGNGFTTAYAHTTKFELFHPTTGELAYTIIDTPIDFMPNLQIVLLGVNSFLSRFVLKIDYPQQIFSIISPSQQMDLITE
ncbi:MAG: hypothetical protein AAB973_03705 [Patescibacteria group bacterium]